MILGRQFLEIDFHKSNLMLYSKCVFKLLPHPLYSYNLAPKDFRLLCDLKKHLAKMQINFALEIRKNGGLTFFFFFFQ